MKTLFKWLGLGLAGVVVLAMGLRFVSVFSRAEKPAPKSKHLFSVQVKQVQKTPIEQWLVGVGTLEAKRQATLVFQRAGKIAWLGRGKDGKELRVGSKIKGPRKGRKGQLLARLDLRETWAGVRGLQASLRATRENLKITQLLIKQVNLQRKQAYRQHRRSKSLYARRALSTADMERVRDALRLSEVRVSEALVRQKAQRISVVSTQQRLRQMRLSLERGELRAPFDGIIAAMNIRKEQVTSGGPSASIKVFDPKSFEARVYLPVDDALRVRKGQKAKLFFDSNGSSRKRYESSAYVAAVSPALSAQQGTVEIILQINEPPSWLREGMKVQSYIRIAHKQNAVTLPRAAILRFGQGTEVFVRSTANNCVERRTVQLGLQGTHKWEILSGLQPGDWVVTTGKHRLFKGACIRPIQ